MHPIVLGFVCFATGWLGNMALYAWVMKQVRPKNKEPSWAGQ